MERPFPLEALGLQFVLAADARAEQLPPFRAYLADQLRRAALSVYLNLKEGVGEFSPGEKARFYRMPFRSLRESCGCLDVTRALHPSLAKDVERAASIAANLGPQIHRLALYQRTRIQKE